MEINRAITSRPLGRIETGLALSNEHWPMNMVAVLRLSPAPEPVHLQTALDRAQRRHPGLRAGIGTRRRRREFVYETASPIELEVVDGCNPADWVVAAETGLNTGVPLAKGPLLAAKLLRSERGGDLVVTMLHSIVDAASAVNLLSEILTTHAELAHGSPPPDATPLGPPVASDDLFPEGYRGGRFAARGAAFGLGTLGAEVRYRRAMRRAAGPQVDPGSRTQIHATGLDPATTTALVRAARRRRITLPSVVHAAALSALHRHRYGARALTLRTFSFPDLRPYLEPAIGPEPLACYMALTWQDVPMTADRDFWQTAAAVQERVDASVRGGAKFLSTAMTIPVMRMTTATKKLRMGNAAVSHTGTVRLAERYGPVEVSDLRAFVSSLAVGPELSLSTRVFHGHLTIDVATLDADMDRTGMERLADEATASLDAAAAT